MAPGPLFDVYTFLRIGVVGSTQSRELSP